MKEELLELLCEFGVSVDRANSKRPIFEDDIEFTLENFYKWLMFEDSKDK
jgi:hypothetical protein